MQGGEVCIAVPAIIDIADGREPTVPEQDHLTECAHCHALLVVARLPFAPDDDEDDDLFKP
jgi:hypothetical protein